MSQKPKRSTSRPRAGTKRTKQVEAPARHVGAAVAPAESPGPVSEGREPNRDRAHRWSITYPTREALFQDSPSERRPPSLEEFQPAALEQFEQARQVAMEVLDSGVVGDRECVTMISGQANTDHQPTNGQPNDRLSISIQQVGS